MLNSVKLSSMVAKGCMASDYAWGLATLANDPLFRMFDQVQQEEIVKTSVQIGIAEAQGIMQACASTDPLIIAGFLGIVINNVTGDTEGQRALRYFAQYCTGVINVYTDMVIETEEILAHYRLQDVLGRFDVKSVLVAHELFHYLEEQKSAIETRHMRVKVKRLGFWSGYVCPYMASEIAAFAFAKCLLQLSFHPRLLELISLYHQEPPISAKIFWNIMEISGQKDTMTGG